MEDYLRLWKKDLEGVFLQIHIQGTKELATQNLMVLSLLGTITIGDTQGLFDLIISPMSSMLSTSS